MHKFCHPKHRVHFDCDSYFIKGRICPFNLPYCELDHEAWERENFRKPWLLDHFLTENTEDYYRQYYTGTDPATWKVKPITQLEQMQHICQG